jgi:beta-lactamase class A
VLGRQQRLGDILTLNVSLVAIVAAGLLAGCGAGGEQGSAASQDVVAHPVAPPPLVKTPTPEATAKPVRTAKAGARAPSSAAASGEILSAADRASFLRLATSLGGEHGLAVSGVGGGWAVERVGELQSGSAWSTAKVPIAMAVIDAGQQGAQQSNLTQAITASDNAAATRLWASLGPPQTAAGGADAELRRAGDQRTSIESRALLGSGYTPFGQTDWSLRDQARFTADLPCSAAGAQVLALMGQVVGGQRWGLGAAGVPAQLKGGWGPGTQPGVIGGYLDRQMGILTISGKPLAVAIAGRPASGSHDSGTRDLTAIARWLVAHASVRAQPVEPTC